MFFGGKDLIDHRSLLYTYDSKSRVSSLDKLRLAESDEEIAAMKGKPHLSLLMTLLYVALYTAPHCLNAIVRQGRFMSNPAPYNWKELCNLFAYYYMYHHRHEGLTICRSFSLPKVPWCPRLSHPSPPMTMPLYATWACMSCRTRLGKSSVRTLVLPSS